MTRDKATNLAAVARGGACPAAGNHRLLRSRRKELCPRLAWSLGRRREGRPPPPWTPRACFYQPKPPDACSSTISALGSVLRCETPLQVSGTAWFRFGCVKDGHGSCPAPRSACRRHLGATHAHQYSHATKVAMRRARCARRSQGRHLCVGGRVGRVSGCPTAPDRETQTQASAPMVAKPPRESVKTLFAPSCFR